MERRLHTVHTKRSDFRTVADRFRVTAAIFPPLWALLAGLWITAGALLLLFVALPVLLPANFAFAAWVGISLVAAWEGGSIERLELGLRGWATVGLVEAASRDGAEELWLTGNAVYLPGKGATA